MKKEHSHSSSKAILAAFLANMGIALAKFIGFLITGASSLLAESIHSVSDSSNQGLLVWGQRSSRKKETSLHQFGYGRSSYFFAFMVSVVLFTLGGVFALYEGIHKVSHPEELNHPLVAFLIFFFAILFEGFALRTAFKHSKPERKQMKVIEYIKRSKNAEFPVLLVEDSAALLGLIFALLGVTTSVITGNPIYDGIGTLLIGVLLIFVGIFLGIEMKSLLLGESLSDSNMKKLKQLLEEEDLVEEVRELKTQYLGPTDLLIVTRLHFKENTRVEEVDQLCSTLNKKIEDALQLSPRIYIEPDEPAGGAEP